MIFIDIGRTVVLTVICCILFNLVSSKPASFEKQSDNKLSAERTEALKKGILERLSYLKPPDISKFNISISEKRKKIREFKEYLNKKQDMHLTTENEESQSPGEIKVYRYLSKGYVSEKNNSVWNSGQKLYFNLNENHAENPNEELVVKSAILKFYKNKLRINKTSETRNEVEISMHNVFNNTNGVMEKRLLESRLIDMREEGWEEIDITNLVQEWIGNEEKIFGIELTSNTHNISDILNSLTIKKTTVLDQTSSVGVLLELKASVQPILKREKRQAARRDCKKGDGETRCCRFTTYISFKELGWDDWILAPPGYEAHYCDGSCPHGFKVANTFASIQSILHQHNPSAIPAPCCVPTELSPLTILHYDGNGEYTFTDHPDMIVEECRCA